MRKASKWEARMMQFAKLAASFSKDPSTGVGVVIYNPARNSIVTTGFNGFPRNTPDTEELYKNKTIKYARVVHAETNAIVEAAYQGVSTNFMHLICTHPPCSTCAGLIIQAGITCVLYEDTGDAMLRHGGGVAAQMFQEAGVRVIALTPEGEDLG